MKASENFDYEEFIDKNTFLLTNSNGIELINQKLISVCQKIRDIIGFPIYINNWSSGGLYNWSGLRNINCPIWKVGSFHNLGMASDLHVYKISSIDLFQIIYDNSKILMPMGLGGMEIGTRGWVHVDIRPNSTGKLILFHG